MFENFLRKFVKWLDPKLEKYRPVKPPKITPKYIPRSIEDFIGILQRTPKNILSSRDRNRIAAIMSFDDRTVGELMIPRSQMIFVGSNEVLGPLILDKLYKSGFTNFPVIDPNNRVKGIIHTEALNALEIKKTDRAEKYINEDVYYLHSNDSLQFAVEEIERTNSYYFLILDEREAIIGFFTIQMLLNYLLN